jgi:hypothetical protein
VAGLGSSVAWRWCSGRCRRSRWSRCSRQRTSPAAPVRAPGSSFPAPSSPGAARRRRAPPLARRRCAGVAAFLLGPAQRRRLLLPPSHGALSGEVERENPNGVGSLDGWLSASPLAFEPWHCNGEAKSPCCPGLDRPGDRGGAAPSFAQARTQGCVWRGVKGVFPRPGRIRLARERAPIPLRAGRLAGAAVPSRAPCTMRLG